MKQVLVRGGGVAVEDVPAPRVGRRNVLVRVEFSAVSPGTETTSIRLSGLPLYRRALAQREHARRVLEKARDEGVVRTVSRVRHQLAGGRPLGYSAAGVVVGVGEEVTGFALGDRVACAGAGAANHAEVIDVPVNLVVRIPDGVSAEHAATVTLGAIALQGVRRVEPTLGETVGVIGLGMLGQLTAQILRAHGCRPIGADPNASRVEQARRNGIDAVASDGPEFVAHAHAVTDGFGADAVVITAATESNEVVHHAFQACRKKGRVVLVGDVGLQLRRADMYEKELDFRMSTSYGPGRYDPEYEEHGSDYPIGYVRWTENRNMEAYLQLLADGRVALEGLTRESYEIDEAVDAYAALERDGERPLLVLLSYPSRDGTSEPLTRLRTSARRTGRVRVALVGAGSFAQGTHLPNLRKLAERYEVRAVASRTGATARAVAERAGAAYATTDVDAVLADEDVDLVLIATRHDLHAPLALRALEAGKHVFVEKPLALNEEQLEALERFYDVRDGPLLMTGFNRRFSPAARRMRAALSTRKTPLIANYRMNAGFLPPEHWVHGPEGGGRNIGEACHVYDLFGFLTGGGVAKVSAHAIRPGSRSWRSDDNFVATVSYDDGSVCTLTYTALGDRAHPKERMEAFADRTVLVLDDYRSLSSTRGRRWRSVTQQKGHREELEALATALREGGPWPISLEEQLRAMRTAFAVEAKLRPG